MGQEAGGAMTSSGGRMEPDELAVVARGRKCRKILSALRGRRRPRIAASVGRGRSGRSVVQLRSWLSTAVGWLLCPSTCQLQQGRRTNNRLPQGPPSQLPFVACP
ncbi:uncharacterized protein [Lolium perenne]|uniref:uncharacterized protein isoform X3 n=1 Tax=Lolium perenne TaxID=4522 RepID=UPI003A9958AB